MARLTNTDKDRLRAQLLAALVPLQADAITKLADAAFAAVATEYFGAKNLKLLAAMPAEWFETRRYAVVRPSAGGVRQLSSTRRWNLPGSPAFPAPGPSAATQAAIDAWDTALTAADKAQRDATHQVNVVLERATTLESLLTLLPAARDILKLPPAEPATDTAAKLNAALAARAPKAPAKPPSPKPPAKPAAKARKPAKKSA